MPARRTRSARSASGPSWARLKLTLWLNAMLAVALGVWFVLQPADRRAEVTQLLGNALRDDKQVRLTEVVWDLYQFYHGGGYVTAPGVAAESHALGGLPDSAGLAHPVRILANTGYTVGYSDSLGSPVWAAYRVADTDERRTAPERPDRFEVDRRTAARVGPEAYTGSGFDRGHLAPNYAIATRYGERAQRETFLMSNIVPQRPGLNSGAWRELEQRVATNYPARYGEVWVLAGPIFRSPVRRLRNAAAVPEAFFMIIADVSGERLRAQAFVFPQDFPAAGDPGAALVPVDEIEARTGLDFFPDLPDAAESALESHRPSRTW
jgi:endonuclease G